MRQLSEPTLFAASVSLPANLEIATTNLDVANIKPSTIDTMAAATLPNISSDLIWQVVREFFNQSMGSFGKGEFVQKDGVAKW